MSQTQTKPTVIIIGRPGNEATLRQNLGAQVNVVAVEPNPGRALGELRSHNPDIALLFMDEAPVPTLDLTRQISSQGGCVPIVVSSNKQPDNEFLAQVCFLSINRVTSINVSYIS